MTRTRRTVNPGSSYHTTQRGHDRQLIFHDDADRIEYLTLIAKYSARHGVRIETYCLMPNHIHLVVVPERTDSLALAIGQAHNCYSRNFNKKYERRGHLWESRFHSVLLDAEHRINALLYVERNPVRAGLVENAWDYTWSGAAMHCGMKDTAGLIQVTALTHLYSTESWKELLRHG